MRIKSYHKGDLVKIIQSSLRYFKGRLALVIKLVHTVECYNDRYDHTSGYERSGDYYLVRLASSEDSHIFHEEDMELVSRVQKYNEV